MDPIPVRGYNKASTIVLLSVMLYQILGYYNCKNNKDKIRAIKYMLGLDDYNNRVTLVHLIITQSHLFTIILESNRWFKHDW